MKEQKELMNGRYAESLELTTSFDANVNHWFEFACQKQGDYLITAVIAKENVKYINFVYPKWITLKNIKKFCKGYNRITLANVSGPYFWAEKMKLLKADEKDNEQLWAVGCGETVFQSRKVTYKNVMDEFKVFAFDRWSYIQDYTIDFWLELTKDLQ